MQMLIQTTLVKEVNSSRKKNGLSDCQVTRHMGRDKRKERSGGDLSRGTSEATAPLQFMTVLRG